MSAAAAPLCHGHQLSVWDGEEAGNAENDAVITTMLSPATLAARTEAKRNRTLQVRLFLHR